MDKYCIINNILKLILQRRDLIDTFKNSYVAAEAKFNIEIKSLSFVNIHKFVKQIQPTHQYCDTSMKLPQIHFLQFINSAATYVSNIMYKYMKLK